MTAFISGSIERIAQATFVRPVRQGAALFHWVGCCSVGLELGHMDRHLVSLAVLGCQTPDSASAVDAIAGRLD